MDDQEKADFAALLVRVDALEKERSSGTSSDETVAIVAHNVAAGLLQPAPAVSPLSVLK